MRSPPRSGTCTRNWASLPNREATRGLRAEPHLAPTSRGRHEERIVDGPFGKLDGAGQPARASTAGPAAGPRLAVIHARWGLHDDVIAAPDGLANEGFSVVAPDLLTTDSSTS
jgi:hypothetical protein